MNVAELLGELALAPHVEVVVARLPERLRGAQRQSARDRLLERLQRLCEPPLFRFAHQQVDVLGHDDEAIDEQSVFVAHCLQRLDEEVTRRPLEVLQRPGHSMSLLPHWVVICDR